MAASHPKTAIATISADARKQPWVPAGHKDGRSCHLLLESCLSGHDAIAAVPMHGYFAPVIRTLPILVMSLALGACDDACTDEVITRLASPNGKREAVMFQRDCGATSGYSTQISILDAGQAPVGGGNTFRADDDHGAAKVGDWGGSWAEIKWLASDRLLIRYADKSRIFEQDNAVAGVSISYETVAM